MEATQEIGPGSAIKTDRDGERQAMQAVMFAAPVRRPQDSLAATLRRLEAHNSFVTSVVLERLPAFDDLPAEGLIDYLEDGVLVEFPAERLTRALLAATIVVQELELSADGELCSRIGIAVGEVHKRNYLHGAPDHRVGEPIEVAARLVSDVAARGQIVLDPTARGLIGPADLDAVRSAGGAPQALLRPVAGAELSIQGMARPVPVFELSLDGTEKALHNRRALARELSQIKTAVVEFRFRLKAERNDISKGGIGDDQWERFDEFIGQLDPDHPKNEAKKLEDAWSAAHEVVHVEALVQAKGAMRKAYESLRCTWEEESGAVRRPEKEGGDAGVRCMEARSKFRSALGDFSNVVNWTLEEIERTL